MGNFNKPSEHTVFQMDVVNFEELDLMKLLSIKVYILPLQCIDDSN